MDPINETLRVIHTVEREAYAQYDEYGWKHPVFGWDDQGHALISLKGRLVRASETTSTLNGVYRDTLPEKVSEAVSESIKAISADERLSLRFAVSEVVESAIQAADRVPRTDRG